MITLLPRRAALLPLLLPLLLPVACAKKKGGPPPKEVVPVLAAKVERRDVPLVEIAVGHVDPQQSVSVRPRIGGEIASVHFREGDDVAVGSSRVDLQACKLEYSIVSPK